MNILDDISQGISNGSLSLEQIDKAACDGIKRFYGVTDLYFGHRYYETETNPDPVYSFSNDQDTGIYCAADDKISIAVGGRKFNLHGLEDDDHPQYLLRLSCSRNPEDIEEIGMEELSKMLKSLSVGKAKIYFSDAGVEFGSLDDLRHANLTLRLSGI